MNHQNCTFISKNEDRDEAMAVTSSYPAHHGNSNPKLSKKGPDCWNCGESGHIHHDCKKPKKKPLTAQSESTNQVTDNSDNEALASVTLSLMLNLCPNWNLYVILMSLTTQDVRHLRIGSRMWLVIGSLRAVLNV